MPVAVRDKPEDPAFTKGMRKIEKMLKRRGHGPRKVAELMEGLRDPAPPGF